MSDFGWRKMGGGSGGGRFRTATPLSNRPALRRQVAVPSVCPTYKGSISSGGIYPALNVAGDQLVNNSPAAGNAQPQIWTYPGLVSVGTFGAATYYSIGEYAFADDGSLAYEGQPTSGGESTIHWVAADQSTETDIYGGTSGHELTIVRWMHDLTRACVFDLNTSTGNVDVVDLDISATLTGFTIPGSFTINDPGQFDLFPIPTSDGAVWYVEVPPYAATTPGQVFRWTASGGSVAVPGIGGANPGIVGQTSYMHLIADDTTVLASIGTTETDRDVVRIQPDLSFETDSCFASLSPDIGFGSFFDSSDASSFYIYASSTTPAGPYLFSPKAGGGTVHIWGT